MIDTERDEVVETISTRPADKLLFGSAPNALAISSDGKTVYASNGTNNAVAVIEFSPGKSRLAGCIPTGWYPAGLVLDGPRKSLYVANVKGVGSRNVDWKGNRKIGGKPVSATTRTIIWARSRSSRCRPRKSWQSRRKTVLDQQSADRIDQRPGAAAQGCSAAAGSRAARRAVGVQARAVHHQGEPHVRPGVRRHRARRRRPRAVHLRPRGHAEPPQAGRRVRAARQLLLQRRAQRRRPSVDQRSLRHRLHRKGLRRLAAQLSLLGRRRDGLCPQRLHLGQRAGAQEDAAHLRRVRARPRSAGKIPPGKSGRRSSIATATSSTTSGQIDIQATAAIKSLRAASLPHGDRLSQHRARRVSGRPVHPRAEGIRSARASCPTS